MSCERDGRLLGPPTEPCEVELAPGFYKADYWRWSRDATGDIVIQLASSRSGGRIFWGRCPVKKGAADGLSGCSTFFHSGNFGIRENGIVFEVPETAILSYWIEPPYCTILLSRFGIFTPVRPPVSACMSPETVTAGWFAFTVAETDDPRPPLSN